ncbi:MAG: ECF transporter S component [Ignavibacteriae bacterium]|nr:ECF transporter S component [Ignavibacteriota bacterium]
MKNIRSLVFYGNTLPLNNLRAYLFESLFVILAVALPSVCHLLGAPVRYILPMHWTVILAGLVYGWRGGAIAGFLSPVVSFLITGMPFLISLVPMTAELFTYGLITGILVQKIKMNSFASIAIALIIGRTIFLFIFIISNQGIDISGYFMSAILPGLIIGLVQIISIPLIAKFWIK